MQTIKCDLPETLDRIHLLAIADQHGGDPNSLPKLTKSRIDYIKNTPNAYCLFNGDLVNWASVMSISDTYGETLTPMQQIEAICKLIDPIKHKTISVTPGNHEFRPYKTEGIDITRLACREIGIENKYSELSMLIYVRLGKNTVNKYHGRPVCYAIYVNHGAGGGRKPGAKVNRLADMAMTVDADVYIHSHTHTPMILRQGYYRLDTANSAVSYTDRLFVNTGAALEYGGYGEAQEFAPASLETPIITLDGTVKRATATL